MLSAYITRTGPWGVGSAPRPAAGYVSTIILPDFSPDCKRFFKNIWVDLPHPAKMGGITRKEPANKVKVPLAYLGVVVI